MIRDGKYRYTLQFGMDTVEERQAGQFLEQLGNRKSPIIVAALNKYLEDNPGCWMVGYTFRFMFPI